MVKCHCRNCQQVSGGAYAPILAVPLKDFRLTAGALQHHATTRLSGRHNLRGFCGNCGSRLTVGEDPDRGLIGLMAGGLDDPGSFQPQMNIFVCDAQPWDVLEAELPRHQEYVPRK